MGFTNRKNEKFKTIMPNGVPNKEWSLALKYETIYIGWCSNNIEWTTIIK